MSEIFRLERNIDFINSLNGRFGNVNLDLFDNFPAHSLINVAERSLTVFRGSIGPGRADEFTAGNRCGRSETGRTDFCIGSGRHIRHTGFGCCGNRGIKRRGNIQILNIITIAGSRLTSLRLQRFCGVLRRHGRRFGRNSYGFVDASGICQQILSA